MTIVGNIVKLFTGKPALLPQKNGLLKTSLFKRKEEHSVYATFGGIVNNELADVTMHGGLDRIAYVYTKEHYDYWKFKRSDLTFTPGIFGENLLANITISESEVFIGDTFKIGSAYFSVSGPRLPCFKLGIRMNDIRFSEEFLLSGKTGFYLRLEKEGSIKKGDLIERISFGNETLNILDVSRLFIQPNLKTLNHVRISTHLASDLKKHIMDRHSMLNLP